MTFSHTEEGYNALRQALQSVREIADGRRHYEGPMELFDALGKIKDLCDKTLSGRPPILVPSSMESVQPEIVQYFEREEADDLDELIAERTKANPDFPKLLDEAKERREKMHSSASALARTIIPTTVVKGENCPKCPLSAATFLVGLEGESEDLRKCMECNRIFTRTAGGELATCWNCDGPADGKNARDGSPMCRECGIYLEAQCPKCKNADATLQRKEPAGTVVAGPWPDLRCCNCGAEFYFCSNCDTEVLIPEGKTAADCVVCNGLGIVEAEH